jgi:hypothetical protein
MGTGGRFPGAKARPGRDADHSPHLFPRSRMSRGYTSSHPKPFVACGGTALCAYLKAMFRLTAMYLYLCTLIFSFTNPNVVVDCLTFLLRIRKVWGSKLGTETCYSDRFSWLSLVPTGKCKDRTDLDHDRFLPHPFQFIIHPPFHLTHCLSY